MDFIDQLKQFSKRVSSMKENIQTEEATKTSIIMPFFSLLGYDVFNPMEFIPEFTADVGIKKGEKVDYAILIDGSPAILVEAKSIQETLDKHDSQLFRYFGTTSAKFAILTNGLIYRFYTDLDEPNKMDASPFLEINILDLKDAQVPELKKFCKSNFNVSDILDTASDLKYSHEFQDYFANQMQDPSDDFVRIFVGQVFSGRITQAVIEKFRPILRKALSGYVNELMNDKIKSALNIEEKSTEIKDTEQADTPSTDNSHSKGSEIITTDEELEAYFIVKNILKDTVPISEITYRDTVTYINVLYQDYSRKWICRLILKGNKKTLIIPDENKNQTVYQLNSIYDIEKYSSELHESLNRYL